MDPENRKLQMRIARRKEKVERMIQEQEAYLDELDPSTFHYRLDYLQAVSAGRRKLSRLEQEMSALESGRLPGMWV